MHLYLAKKSEILVSEYFRYFWLTFVQDKPFTINVCFQSLMILLENVNVAEMIVNGFLHFYIFKTDSIVLIFFTQTCDQD